MQDPIFRYFFGDRLDSRPRQASNLGSGVIVSQNGYILTNQHVVEAADEIQVALADGKILPARVVGTDPETDLAVLKIDAGDLPAITFAQADSLKVGDWVLAVGNPFGVGQTVTAGIVSALGRTHLGINTFENFIQTDAAINPGNSGGALVDAAGNLVGVNSAIYSRTGGSQGIGFAIPVSIVRQVMEQIIKIRQRDARLGRHRSAGPDPRTGRILQSEKCGRRPDRGGAEGRPRQTRAACVRAIFCWLSTASRSPTRPRCST